jgi:HSP20 family protein
MAITRFDRDFGRFQSRMNRLLEDAFRGESEQEFGLTDWAPLVDIYEREGNLVLTAELPGVRPEDVKVNIENHVLTISGERKLEQEASKDNFHRIERAYGRFVRSFTLSPQYDTENIRAEFRDGVLRIEISRSEKARPRQIPIAGGAQQQLQGQQQQQQRKEAPGRRAKEEESEAEPVSTR